MARGPLRRAALVVAFAFAALAVPPHADAAREVRAASEDRARGGAAVVVQAALATATQPGRGVAASPAAVVRVPVRGGSHPGYGRVVFHWPSPVEYSVSRAGDVVIVRFGRAAAIDTAQLNARLPRYVSAIRSDMVGERSRVTLLIDPEGRLRHFRAGTTVVLDIIGAPKVAGAPAAAARPAAPRPMPAPPAPPMAKPALAKALDLTATPGRAAADTEPSEPPKPSERPEAQAGRAVAPGSMVSDAPPSAPAVASRAPAMDAPAMSPPPVAAKPPRPESPSTPDDSAAPAMAGEPMPLVVARAAETKAPPPRALSPAMVRSLGRPAAEVMLTAPPMVVQLRAAGNPTLVSFSGGKAIPGAAFIRAQHLWVVFPGVYMVDLGGARGARNSAYDSISQIPHPTATVLRFKLRDGFGAALRRRGTLWIAYFTKNPEPPAAISVRSIGDGPRGHRVHLALANVSDTVEVRDPDDGASLFIVPVATSGAGVVPGQRFPDFDLLPTVQGIVVRPADEKVVVRTGPAGVDIGLVEGLSLAPTNRRPARQVPRADGDVAVFDLAVWRRGGDAMFGSNRRDLQLAAAGATPGERTPARIELAQFLFAHGYFVEVLGLLELLMAQDEDTADDYRLRAMRGVAQLMIDHVDDAAADLNDQALSGFDDVVLWRGVLAMRQGDTVAAAKHFARAGSLWLYELMPHLRDEVGLIAAEAALETHDLAAASAYLDAIQTSKPPLKIRDRARYLRGRVLWAASNEKEALKLWEKTANSSDRFTRSGTLFYRTKMLLESGDITAKEAIEQWEKLRFAWRGDRFEIALLKQLAEVYVAERDYRRALEAMKRAATDFVGHPTATTLAVHMNQLFAEIFAHGGAEDLPVRDALTLFFEYRDLVPAGAVGDTVILGLADRLVAVDLLDRAAELLDHQVKNRLKGLEKARVGARLAVIRLMDNRPEPALRALDASAVESPPESLAEQRRHLRARALADLGRKGEALQLIARDTSLDAKLLRADILWRAGDWAKAATATEDVLAMTPIETPLSPFASRHILRQAVALALDHDRTGLDRVRERYADLMKNVADRYAFDLVTSPADGENLSFRRLPAALAQVASFEAFMASYRDRVQDRLLSTIN